MRNLILFGLFIILLLAAQFASAKTVDEVIEKYIRARGGKDKLASVKSIYMEGLKEIMGRGVAVKIIKEQDRLSRTEMETGDTNSLMLITPTAAWTFFSPGSIAAVKVPDEELAGLETETDIAGPLVDYVAKGHKAELLGKDIIEGSSCYKIRLMTKTGKEMMFWVDTNSYLVKQASATTTRDGSKEALTLYKNYQEVAGIQFAHTQEIKIIGINTPGINGEVSFHKIVINPAIDPKMFLPEFQS